VFSYDKKVVSDILCVFLSAASTGASLYLPCAALQGKAEPGDTPFTNWAKVKDLDLSSCHGSKAFTLLVFM
jgi:hypothetical protein